MANPIEIFDSFEEEENPDDPNDPKRFARLRAIKMGLESLLRAAPPPMAADASGYAIPKKAPVSQEEAGLGPIKNDHGYRSAPPKSKPAKIGGKQQEFNARMAMNERRATGQPMAKQAKEEPELLGTPIEGSPGAFTETPDIINKIVEAVPKPLQAKTEQALRTIMTSTPQGAVVQGLDAIQQTFKEVMMPDGNLNAQDLINPGPMWAGRLMQNVPKLAKGLLITGQNVAEVAKELFDGSTMEHIVGAVVRVANGDHSFIAMAPEHSKAVMNSLYPRIKEDPELANAFQKYLGGNFDESHLFVTSHGRILGVNDARKQFGVGGSPGIKEQPYIPSLDPATQDWRTPLQTFNTELTKVGAGNVGEGMSLAQAQKLVLERPHVATEMVKHLRGALKHTTKGSVEEVTYTKALATMEAALAGSSKGTVERASKLKNAPKERSGLGLQLRRMADEIAEDTRTIEEKTMFELPDDQFLKNELIGIATLLDQGHTLDQIQDYMKGSYSPHQLELLRKALDEGIMAALPAPHEPGVGGFMSKGRVPESKVVYGQRANEVFQNEVIAVAEEYQKRMKNLAIMLGQNPDEWYIMNTLNKVMDEVFDGKRSRENAIASLQRDLNLDEHEPFEALFDDAMEHYKKYDEALVKEQEKLNKLDDYKKRDVKGPMGWRNWRDDGPPDDVVDSMDDVDPDDLASMAVTGKGKAGASWHKNTFESLGAGLYKGNPAKTVVKETVQNSIDAIRKRLGPTGSGGRLAIHLDDSKRSIRVTDNGTGMSTEDALTKLLDIGDPGKASEAGDNLGGFGLAKIGMFGKAEDIKIETIIQTKDGWEYTKITGNAEKWKTGDMDYTTDLLTLEQAEGLGFDDIGTRIEIKFDKDADAHFWEARNYLANIKTKTLPTNEIDFRFTENSWNGTKEIESDQIELKKGKTIKLNNATIRVWESTERGDGGYVWPVISNQGIPQINMNGFHVKGGGDDVPKNIIFDITPTVKPNQQNYPFTTSRDEVKDNINDAIQAYMNNLVFEGAKKEANLLLKSVTNPVRMKKNPAAIYGIGDNSDRELMEHIADQNYMRELALLMKQKGSLIYDLLTSSSILSSIKGNTPPVFGGIGLGPKYLGVNIRTKSLQEMAKESGVQFPNDLQDKGNLILINPYNIWNEISPEDISLLGKERAFSEMLWSTLVHENLHQKIRGHDENWSSWLTMTIGRVAEAQMKNMDEMNQISSKILNSNFYTDLEEVMKLWKSGNNKEIFKGVTGHDY